MNHTIFLSILTVLSIAFIIIIIKILFDVCYSTKSLSWPSVDGVIVKMRKVQEFQNDSNDMLDIKYSFKIGDSVFTSKRIRFGVYNLSTIGKNELNRYLESYPEGKIVNVYYDPTNPKRSVLINGFNNALYLYLAAFLLMLFFCLFRIITNNY